MSSSTADMPAAQMGSPSSYRRAFRLLREKVVLQTQQVRATPRGARIERYLTTGIGGGAREDVGSTSEGAVDTDLEAIEVTDAGRAPALVLFPTYARASKNDVVVNVHGWAYSLDSAGRQSRRNRYTMLLARSVAGLPSLPPSLRIGAGAATQDDPDGTSGESRPVTANSNSSSTLSIADQLRDEMLDGQHDSDATPIPSPTKLGRNFSIASEDSDAPPSPKFDRHYADHDLVTCHANLTSRIAPFLSRSLADQSVTVEVVTRDGEVAGSQTFTTGESGHLRGQISIPRCVKVDQLTLRAHESGAALGEIHIDVLGDAGVSVISDMDDTIKHTGIVAGMREAFRNAFVRNLDKLEIPGVREWYKAMDERGCPIHYVSNAPYQLWPSLAKFLEAVQLPRGSVHLKAYSGVLQGIWEPAAEKKRASVEALLTDFPDRKFVLIGDSGEQDLELYASLAQSHTEQILGIFIRNVSVPAGFEGARPTGSAGEDFFSANARDDVIDSAPQKQDQAAPPLPPRQRSEVSDLVDVSSPVSQERTEKDDHTDDLMSLMGDAPSNATKSPPRIPPKPKNLTRQKPSLAIEIPPSFGELAEHRKHDPEAKLEEIKETQRAKRPFILRSLSSSTVNSTMSKDETSAPKRAGLLRQWSARSLTGEGRPTSRDGGDISPRKTEAWSRRLQRARASLPDEIKLYIWREGADAEQHALELIDKAQARQL